MNKEIWKDIKGYEGLYQVSNLGNIRSLYKYKGSNKRVLHKIISNKGYYVISLVKNKRKKQYRVHQLVANAFIINDNNYPVINHIDGNKLNNNVTNLEWCTVSHNNKEAYRIGLSKPNRVMLGRKSEKCPNSIPINQYDMNGNFIRRWNCSYDVIRELGLRSNHIANCCKGDRNSFAGYKWSYANDI